MNKNIFFFIFFLIVNCLTFGNSVIQEDMLSNNYQIEVCRKLLFCNLETKSIYMLCLETNTFEEIDNEILNSLEINSINSFNWNPITKKNLIETYGTYPKYYYLKYADNKVIFEETENFADYFITEAEYNINQNLQFTTKKIQDGKKQFILINQENEENLWELTVDNYQNIYWINDEYYFLKNELPFAVAENDNKNASNIWSIQNYKTKEQIEFDSKVIIGYGENAIITSIISGNDFIGIEVYNPYGEKIYEIKDIVFSENIEIYSPFHKKIVYRGYYDFPYIYLTLCSKWMYYEPSINLILNLATNEIITIPEKYMLIGIF